ncbi:hypothetical protein [Tateyamaria sp. SN6-1]|uniref:DUF7933 domain-containing protein n=1 Tax=Tateyamaria sp. SN6-1 TaxID=3092148 RepID=UPI0039F56A5C
MGAPSVAFADPPAFSQVVSPSNAAINTNARLTYTINNSGADVVTALAFNAVLPANVQLSSTPDASTTCGGENNAAFANLTTSGSDTISFSNGEIGGADICTVSVNIVGTAAGTFSIPVVTLTSSETDVLAAATSFTVNNNKPSFSLSAAPSVINLGDTTTVTFTVDNTINPSAVGSLDFTTSLPSGLQIANPSNASTSCISATAPNTTLTAVPGEQSIVLDANGNAFFPGFEVLAAGATCTVSVNVIANGVGNFTIDAPSLQADFTDVGGAAANVQVDASDLNVTATVLNTPVNAGTSAQVEFLIQNLNRAESATAVAFTSDPAFFTPFVSGVTSSVVSNTCGGSASGGAVLQLSGGVIGAQGSCRVVADFTIPASTAGGNYTISTTTPVTGTVASAAVTGNAATANFVVPTGGVAPTISIEFLEVGTLSPNPTPAPGDDVILRATITNGSSSSAASDISATISLAPPLPFPVSLSAPSNPCGAGSSFAATFPGTEAQDVSLSNGSLAAAPGAGSSCTFESTITLPANIAPGSYAISAEGPTATFSGGSFTGAGASATLTVGSGLNLNLSKSFLSAGFPGSTVDLELSIANASEFTAAEALAFSDDVDAMLTGTTVASVQSDTCGGTAGGTGTGLFSYSGGVLAANEACAIVVRLNIPAAAAVGDYTNTTTSLSGTPAGGGITEVFAAATADLTVSSVTFSKEFLPNTAIPGDTLTLRYTIDNLDPSSAQSISFFTENLPGYFAGFAATGPATQNTCGGSLSGTTFLIYSGGSVPAGGSCVIEVDVLVPLATVAGDYSNSSSSLTLSSGAAIDPAVATLTVQPIQIELVKEFTDDPVVVGGTANVRYTISNLSGARAVSAVAFTDDLSSLPSGTVLDATTNDGCSATIAGAGTSTVDVSGVALAAGASCVIDLALSLSGSATAGNFTSTTSDLTGLIDGLSVTGSAATDTLVVTNLALTFAKAFTPATVAIADATTVTYTITNASGSAAEILSFVDDFGSTIPGATLSNLQTDCSGASLSGTSALNFTGGSVPGTSSCTVSAEVAVPLTATAGVVTSTSSALTSNGLVLAPAAAADLTILTGADIAVTVSDGVTSVNAGNIVTYTIVASNNGPAIDSSVSLIDTFPSDLACTYTSVAAGGATGNTASGSGNLSETLSMPSGSSVTYTASCTVSITAAAGSLSNTATVSGSITDPNPANNSATDSDTVIVPVPTPGFAKAFAPSTIAQGGVSTTTLTIDNSAASFAATNLDFTDTLPTGMIVATPSNAATSCSGGTVTATAGAGSASYTGGTVGAGATCTVSFDVVAQNSGSLVNTTQDLTSLFGNSGTATATLSVTPAPAPTFAKTFSPTSIEVGGVTTVAITVDNTAALVAATGGSFTYTFPTELTAAAPSNAVMSCGASGSTFTSFSATASALTVSGLNIAAGDTCTFGLDLQGISVNTSISSATSELVTNLGSSGTAGAFLGVTSGPAPAISGAFSPDPVDPGAVSTVTFTLTNNSTLIEATGAAFSATLPTNLVVASPANDSTTCSAGTVTASGSSISFAGGTLPLNGSCTVSVDTLTTANDTTQTVNTSTLVTNVATSAAGAAVDLAVNAATEPVLAKSFAPGTITQGEVSTLTFSVMNGAGITTGPITISEALTGGAVLADPVNLSGTCASAATTASAGDAAFTITGFTLAPSASCEVSVDVTSTTIGTSETSTTALASDIGGATPLAATLTTNAAPTPTVAVSFDLASVVQGGTATLTIDITNSAGIDAGNLAFNDALPTGMFFATGGTTSNTCGGTFNVATGFENVSLVSGALTAGATCQISLTVTPTVVGTNTYEVSATSDLGNSEAASDSITVTAAPVPTLAASFAPATIEEGGSSTLSITIDNTTSLIDATDVAVSLSLLTGLEEFGTSSFATTCSGLTRTSADTLAFTGGVVAAGADCSASIEIRAVADGTFTQPTGDVTSSLGTSASVDADLTVNPANALDFRIAINPSSTTQGNSATVTVRLDNSANLIAASDAAFSVSLGGTMQVAPVANGATTCAAGTVSAVTGGNSASFSAGTITEGTTCDVTFDVTSFDTGSFTATLGNLTTSVADTTGGATASLSVAAAPAPAFGQSYTPSTIGQGETSRLRLEIDNSASGIVANRAGLQTARPATNALGFNVTLPIGMTIEPNPNTSNSCGGLVTAVGNGSSVALTGGSVGAASTCAVEVNVTSITEGTLASATGGLTSSSGNATLSAATTPFVVTDNPFGSVTFVQNSVLDGTFNFASSEPSLTFDIAVSGGSGSFGPVALDAGTYTISQTRPSGLANATLVCSDPNTTVDVITGGVTLVIDDGDNFTCTWSANNSIEDTVEAINSFLQRRNNLILSNGPSSARRMARLNQGVGRSETLRFQNGDLASATPFSFDLLSIGSGNYKFSTSLQQVERSRRMFMLMVDGVENNSEVYTPPRWDVWFEATFAEFSASEADGHFAVAHLGADYLVNDDLLLGFALQYDSLDQGDNGGETVEGNGWMAGPYMTARIAENLIFDGRIAYGQSSNTYDPKTTYIDKFDSDRFLVEATLSGNFDWDNWVVTPNFSMAYIEDTAESYLNGLGQTIPEQKVSLGQIRFGPTFSTTFEGRNQTLISPTFSINGIYNFADTDGVTLVNDTSEETNGFRARLEAGVRITGRSGVQFEAGAHYDGIGQSDFESYGARLRVVVPLN